MRRREFIEALPLATGACWLEGVAQTCFSAGTNPSCVLVKNSTASELTRKAIEMLGGMSRFVKPGQTIVIKPNMSWDRPPEMAANTNPDVVAEVVKMCGEASASRVMVFDRFIEGQSRSYITSGIAKAAAAAGADVHYVNDRLFEPVKIENGFALKDYKFYREAIEGDLLINIPVLKRHNLTLLTMGFKNMMGVVGNDRNRFHANFDRMIVDIHRVLHPGLTILDASRALVQNGPEGGSVAWVMKFKTIVAGSDPVMVDTAGAQLLGMKSKALPYLALAEQAGLGSCNIAENAPATFSF
jgi:uncharacterized protein (DUF362 family)